MSIESLMASNHLICHSLLLPSFFPSIRVFSSESVFHTRWPKYCSFSFSISPSNEYSRLNISSRIDWFDLIAVQGTLESSPGHEHLMMDNLYFNFPSGALYPGISMGDIISHMKILGCWILSNFSILILPIITRLPSFVETSFPSKGR